MNNDQLTTRRGEIEKRIHQELAHAAAKYGHYRSTHEGYGVLAEEVAELLEAIQANDDDGVYREAIQIAAVGRRIAECVCGRGSRQRSGMG